MVSYFEKAKLKMLTFKRLIHSKRKSSSNPYESMGPALLVYARPGIVRGAHHSPQ